MRLIWHLLNLVVSAILITALIAAVGIYPIYRSLRQNERGLRFQVYYNVLEMIEKHRPERHLIDEKLKDSVPFERLSDDEKERLNYLARAYDKLGILIKYGVVPLEFALDFYGRPLVVAWKYLESHVRDVRTIRQQSGHMKKFELLAIEAQKYREENFPGEETFLMSKEHPKSWEKSRWHR